MRTTTPPAQLSERVLGRGVRRRRHVTAVRVDADTPKPTASDRGLDSSDARQLFLNFPAGNARQRPWGFAQSIWRSWRFEDNLNNESYVSRKVIL